MYQNINSIIENIETSAFHAFALFRGKANIAVYGCMRYDWDECGAFYPLFSILSASSGRPALFDTVIFDLDGTLLDTLKDLAAACNHTLAAMGLPTHPVAAYRQMVGNGISNLIARMLPPEARSDNALALAAELFGRYYSRHMVDFSAPYPGLPPLLAALGRQGVRMAVASNKAHPYVQPIVRQFFPDLFAAVRGQLEDVPRKPDPAIVHHLLAEMNPDTGPHRTLVVGDSDVDVYTAHNAGLPCCGVLWGFRGREELLAAGADYLVENADDLYTIIVGSPQI